MTDTKLTPEEMEPIAWMREWHGDESDYGNYLFVANADERDDPFFC